MTLMKFSESLEITPRTSQLETLTALASLTQQILFDIHLTRTQGLLLARRSRTGGRFLTLYPPGGYFGRGCSAHPRVPTLKFC